MVHGALIALYNILLINRAQAHIDGRISGYKLSAQRTAKLEREEKSIRQILRLPDERV